MQRWTNRKESAGRKNRLPEPRPHQEIEFPVKFDPKITKLRCPNCPVIQFATINSGAASTARSRSSRLLSLTCGTSRKSLPKWRFLRDRRKAEGQCAAQHLSKQPFRLSIASGHSLFLVNRFLCLFCVPGLLARALLGTLSNCFARLKRTATIKSTGSISGNSFLGRHVKLQRHCYTRQAFWR